MKAIPILLTLASAAHGQTYLPYKMVSSEQHPFSVYVDSRRARPAGLEFSLMQQAAERGWATWNSVQCAYPKVRVLGPTASLVSNVPDTFDSFSVTPVWVLADDPDAQEVFGSPLLITAITLPRAYAGVLETCDIFINAAKYEWSVDSATPAQAFDVETVLLHEAGHCLGLGHLESTGAVMSPSVSVGAQKRALTATDVEVFCARYPLQGAVGSPCLPDGGCVDAAAQCVEQPANQGLSVALCSTGCTVGSAGGCDLPLSCQPSPLFPPFDGACMLPGDSVTAVGKACSDDATCGLGRAHCQRPESTASGTQSWVDGYCTQSCAPGEGPCPFGSSCTALDAWALCLQNCRVGFADCRPFYACAQSGNAEASGVCVPQCASDQDCADPLGDTCRACDGLCVPRQSVGGHIGDLCSSHEVCGAGQVCRSTGLTGTVKQCTQQCALACGVCPEGSACTPDREGALFCLRSCADGDPCPEGLACQSGPVGRVCQPACQSDTDCPVGQRCLSGVCLTPGVDAGAIVAPDAGATGTGSASCGCQAFDGAAGLVVGCWLRWRRRSR